MLVLTAMILNRLLASRAPGDPDTMPAPPGWRLSQSLGPSVLGRPLPCRAGHAGLEACQVFGPFGLARPLAVPLGRRHRGVAQPSFFRPGERHGRDGPT